jgi:hypothetical protein
MFETDHEGDDRLQVKVFNRPPAHTCDRIQAIVDLKVGPGFSQGP